MSRPSRITSRAVVRCRCGLTYLPRGWFALPLVRRTYGQNLTEHRVCKCGVVLRAMLDKE